MQWYVYDQSWTVGPGLALGLRDVIGVVVMLPSLATVALRSLQAG